MAYSPAHAWPFGETGYSPLRQVPHPNAEQQEAWNGTDKAYNLAIPVHRYFELQAERQPAHPALLLEGQEISYAALNRSANQLARFLSGKGAQPGQVVAVLMERSADMVIALLAILKCGAAYLPIDPDLPADRITYMLSNAGVQLLLTHKDLFRPDAPFGGTAVRYDCEEEMIALLYEAGDFCLGIHQEDLAYVIYTSGSTGRPKACMLPHRALANRLLWMQDRYPLGSADRVLQKTPFSFDVSVWEFFWPLLAGATIVMARPGGHKSPKYLVDVITRCAVTVCHFVPSMFSLFLHEPNCTACTTLRYVFTSGEALPYRQVASFLDRFACRLVNLYGPTEAAIDVTSWECEKRPDEKVFIGKPIANTQIYILDQHLQPVATGEKGELYIGGAGLAHGYLNNEDLTRQRFINNPLGQKRSARLYKTGDEGRFHPDGNIEYLGRLDFQVKIRGLRVELGEIESLLVELEAVKEAIVMARPLGCNNLRLVAYITVKESLSKSGLRHYLKNKLPEYAIPHFFVILDALPVTAHGKLDRDALPWPVGLTGQADSRPG